MIQQVGDLDAFFLFAYRLLFCFRWGPTVARDKELAFRALSYQFSPRLVMDDFDLLQWPSGAVKRRSEGSGGSMQSA